MNSNISAMENINQAALDNFRSKFYSTESKHPSGLSPESLNITIDSSFTETLKKLENTWDLWDKNIVELNQEIMYTIKSVEFFYSYDTPEFLQKNHIENYFEPYFILEKNIKLYLEKFTSNYKRVASHWGYEKDKKTTSFGWTSFFSCIVLIGVWGAMERRTDLA